MESLNLQLLDGLYRLLTSKPIDFIIQHTMLVGLITGVLAVIPFVIKQIPHLLILLVCLLLVIYVMDSQDIAIHDALYSGKMFLVVRIAGDYIIGCVYGFVVANLIQRLRGEHDHVTK